MEELTPKERAVLKALRGGPLTAEELAERTGIKRRTVYLLLTRLRDKGAVERGWEGYRIRGPDPAGAYEAVFVAFGILAVLASVPLGDPALTLFGALAALLGRAAGRGPAIWRALRRSPGPPRRGTGARRGQ